MAIIARESEFTTFSIGKTLNYNPESFVQKLLQVIDFLLSFEFSTNHLKQVCSTFMKSAKKLWIQKSFYLIKLNLSHINVSGLTVKCISKL